MSAAGDALLRRFGLGLRPGDRARIGSDARGALLAELDRPPPTPRLAALPPGTELARRLGEIRREIERGRAETRAPEVARDGAPERMEPAAMVQLEDRPRQAILLPELEARQAHQLDAPLGLIERLTLFWANHFAVSVRKGGAMLAFAPAFEREAIRPHALGRFEDLLLAATRHPAMIYYLDNQASIGPGSPAGRRQSDRGLNENLAREILELHTVGVAAGYGQADVVELAKALTGWSIGRAEEPEAGGFRFRPFAHEPGPRSVLGRTYPQEGEAQGEAILRGLAWHPATARRIADRLARHFVADEPPPALVGRLEDAFKRSGGDLKLVTRTLIAAPEAAGPPTKLRSPQEFLLATLRATGIRPPAARAAGAANALGQPAMSPPSPKGFPDDFAAWGAPDAVRARLDFALQYAERVQAGVDPRALAEDVLGGLLSEETRAAIARAESRQQALALMLMSPEFQRR